MSTSIVVPGPSGLRSFSRFLACPALVLALLLAASATPAATLPASEACPDPAVALLGTTGADKLKAGRASACLLADEGDDRLRGSRQNDLLDPGPGTDRVSAGAGDDVIVIRGACETGAGEKIRGGGGDDTLRSPFTAAELDAMGVDVRSVEHFETLVAENDGACASTAGGVVCTCCNRSGFSAEAGCQRCSDGFLKSEPRDADGDAEDARIPEASCDPVPSCTDLACGPHGSCMESAAHGPTCACAPGWAGSACDSCAPLFESTVDGRCAPDRTCAKEMCGGHGRCTADDAGGVSCDCDPGFEGLEDCGGPDVVVGGPKAVRPGGAAVSLGVLLKNGAHCTDDFTWSVSGGGSVQPSATDSRQAAYTPPSAVQGRLDVATVRAVCDNNDELEGRFDIDLFDDFTMAPQPAISGSCVSALAPVEEAVLEWIGQQDIEGATLAVTYQEKLLCLRGYGLRENDPSSGAKTMRQCTPMRVASVTKPFTRAAFRGNLFGMTIPPGLGGGVLGENTPLLPLVATTMGLTPGGGTPWQAPASLYLGGHPVQQGFVPCSTNDGLVNANWNNVTINNTLAHTAGFQPNGAYRFAPGTNVCTGAVGEVCGQLAGVGDPTVNRSTRVANDLGLDHGVPDLDDVVAWTSGLCPFDVATAGRFRYSNLGFSIAGKAIENLTGQTYEDFVTGFLDDDDVIGLSQPGSPIVYQGQNKAGGPSGWSLPPWMQEAAYYTWRGSSTDVTETVLDPVLGWTFPEVEPAPYGGTNYDIMAPHGGLVMNALALAKFGGEYLVKDGTPRAAERGGAGRNVYFPTDTGIGHGGLLFGTSAMTWEIPVTQPANSRNANGPGCLLPGDKQDVDDATNGNGLNVLDVAPCAVPPGIRVSVIFNGEQRAGSDPLFIRGRHDWGLLAHMLRKAASDVGASATAWNALLPLGDKARRIGCDVECWLNGCGPWSCGDGVKDSGEECDDGNHDFGDTCQPDCTVPPNEPAGYAACAGEDPGNCLGGPCAPRDEKFVTDSDRLDPYSPVHPDGDFSPHAFCHDSHTVLSPPWEEATCVKTTVLGKKFGVCQECGVGTMVGCTCPAPNAEDGGCNIDGVSTGLSCVGGRCWKDLPPDWMCTADCDAEIYGTGGHCNHDDPKGAVCNHAFCDEPVPGYCGIVHGDVCDINVNGCANDSCCNPECLDEQDCDSLGYSPGHLCVNQRCVLQ